jgi:hypothetical protein
MTVRKGLIVVVGFMTAGVAHAEDAPSNAELFRMLKAQQQTISELRAELKQARQEQRAAGSSQRREVETAARQAGREAAREAVAATTVVQTPVMYARESAALQSPARGAYVSLFGGGGGRSSSDVTQRGTLYFIEADGGPLAVDASGQTNSGGVWFAGAHIGHEWSYGSLLLPAFEIEGLYIGRSEQRATLQNPTDRLAAHTFDNTLPMSTAAVLANIVVGFRTPYQGVTPYVGIGMGAAYMSTSGATSTQTTPLEAGVNHFNSDPDSSVWGFAAQAKAGARFALGNSGAYLFGEYRYLYVGAVDHIFGSTRYVNHAATSPWTVSFDDTSYHLATAGIGFSF